MENKKNFTESNYALSDVPLKYNLKIGVVINR